MGCCDSLARKVPDCNSNNCCIPDEQQDCSCSKDKGKRSKQEQQSQVVYSNKFKHFGFAFQNCSKAWPELSCYSRACPDCAACKGHSQVLNPENFCNLVFKHYICKLLRQNCI